MLTQVYKFKVFVINYLTIDPVQRTSLITFRFQDICNAFHILLFVVKFPKKTTNRDVCIPLLSSNSFDALTLKKVQLKSSSLSSSVILVTETNAPDRPALCKSETVSGLASAKIKRSPGKVLYGSLPC